MRSFFSIKLCINIKVGDVMKKDKIIKIVKIILITIFIIIISAATLFIGNCVRLIVLEKRDDIHLKMSDVKTAGVKDKYIPQGLTYSNKYKMMIQTSYNKEGKTSRLYVSNLTTGRLERELILLNSDGTENNSHVGGITTDDNKVWITSDFTIWEYSLDEIMNTTNEYVQSVREDELPIRGDFCTYTENKLWIGDFFLKPFYKVPNDTPLLLQYSTIKVETPPPAENTSEENTEENAEETSNEEGENQEQNNEENNEQPQEEVFDGPIADKVIDIDYSKPEKILSLPKMVQGMVIFENKEEGILDIYCDQSFTYLVQSTFIHYKVNLNENKEEFDFYGNKTDYYRFENAEIVKEEKMPPMAEGMTFSDRTGKREIYIVFESNSDAYKFAVPKMDRVMKYNMDRKNRKVGENKTNE